MIEVLFVLIIMFVAYIIYKPAKDQEIMPPPQIRQVKPEPPIVPVASKIIPEESVAAVKPPTSRPAQKKAKAVTSKSVATATATATEKSVQELVGITAGSIWHYLDKNGPTSVAKMIRELQEDAKIIQRSIGWLAQEGKITLKIIDRVEIISLKE